MKIRTVRVVLIVAVAALVLTLLGATTGYASAVGDRNTAILLGGTAGYLFSQDQPGPGLLAATGSAIAWDAYNRDRFVYPVRYRRHYYPYYPGPGIYPYSYYLSGVYPYPYYWGGYYPYSYYSWGTTPYFYGYGGRNYRYGYHDGWRSYRRGHWDHGRRGHGHW